MTYTDPLIELIICKIIILISSLVYQVYGVYKELKDFFFLILALLRRIIIIGIMRLKSTIFLNT